MQEPATGIVGPQLSARPYSSLSLRRQRTWFVSMLLFACAGGFAFDVGVERLKINWEYGRHLLFSKVNMKSRLGNFENLIEDFIRHSTADSTATIMKPHCIFMPTVSDRPRTMRDVNTHGTTCANEPPESTATWEQMRAQQVRARV